MARGLSEDAFYIAPIGTITTPLFSGISLSARHTIAPRPLLLESVREKLFAILLVGVPVCFISIG